MQFLETLEEYLETSQYLPMSPYTFIKLSNISHHILKTSDNPKSPPKNCTNEFHSNENTPNKMGKKELTCIPIVSNEKWVGVVTEEQTTNTPSPSETESIPLDTVKTVLHEINTPLNIIKNYMHILGKKLSQHNIATDEISIIKEEVDRVSHLLSGLVTSPRTIPEHTEPVDINKQAADLIKILKEPLAQKSNIEIALNIDSTLPLFYAKKDSIKQIFINLIKNSVDAMPDGGYVNIQTKYILSPDTNRPTDCPRLKGNLEIIVSDTGTGIPPDIETIIFEPSVSSKKKNHFGIGLSIVRDIVESLNGKISFRNNKDKGAAFQITFPLYDSVLCNYGMPA